MVEFVDGSSILCPWSCYCWIALSCSALPAAGSKKSAFSPKGQDDIAAGSELSAAELR